MRIFTGWDRREAVGWHAFVDSMIEHGWPRGVSVTPLSGNQADGTNAFTYERFRIPEICGFQGSALFVDASDMLLVANIQELLELYDPSKAVQVVKHDYKTRHSVKYVGTALEARNDDYPRKNRSSVILWNCAHPAHLKSREALRGFNGAFLHRFAWLKDEEIGELPIEWNWLADEFGDNPNAKLLHWTAGIPGFYHYKDSPRSDDWRRSVRNTLRGLE